jgi:hypothetical protein
MLIYWDTTTRKIVRSTTDVSEITDSALIARDQEAISIALLEKTGSGTTPYTVSALAATDSKIILAAKQITDSVVADSPYLCYAEIATLTGSGDTLRYTGTLNLNTDEIESAMGTADYLTAQAELTVLTTTDTHRLSTRFALRIYKKVVTLETAGPATYLPAWRYVTNAAGHAGVQLYNYDGVLLAEFYPPGV